MVPRALLRFALLSHCISRIHTLNVYLYSKLLLLSEFLRQALTLLLTRQRFSVVIRRGYGRICH